MKKLLDVEHTPDGLIRRDFLINGPNGQKQIARETYQDVQPVLDANKRWQNAATQHTRRGSFNYVAEIPRNAVKLYLTLRGINYEAFYKEFVLGESDRAQKILNEMLNDSNFKDFRTNLGRVDMRPRSWV